MKKLNNEEAKAWTNEEAKAKAILYSTFHREMENFHWHTSQINLDVCYVYKVGLHPPR